MQYNVTKQNKPTSIIYKNKYSKNVSSVQIKEKNQKCENMLEVCYVCVFKYVLNSCEEYKLNTILIN